MENLFSHVLVPLDFTAKNDVALSFAIRLAQQNQASVTLLHVIERIDYAEDDELRTFYDAMRSKAEAKLKTAIARFEEASIPVVACVELGKAAPTIVDHTLNNETDLVVLGSHKVALDDRPKGWATVSYQVSILCQCPVILVK